MTKELDITEPNIKWLEINITKLEKCLRTDFPLRCIECDSILIEINLVKDNIPYPFISFESECSSCEVVTWFPIRDGIIITDHGYRNRSMKESIVIKRYAMFFGSTESEMALFSD